MSGRKILLGVGIAGLAGVAACSSTQSPYVIKPTTYNLNGQNPNAGDGLSTVGGPAPAAPPSASPSATMVSQTLYFVFGVTGTGPMPQIQYGDDNGEQTVTPSALPWSATENATQSGAYQYLVTASGSGTYTAHLTEKVVTVCSNGRHTESFPLSDGTGDNTPGNTSSISYFEQSDDANATQAEHDAGC